jgi:hypothetical protein
MLVLVIYAPAANNLTVLELVYYSKYNVLLRPDVLLSQFWAEVYQKLVASLFRVTAIGAARCFGLFQRFALVAWLTTAFIFTFFTQ